MSIFFLIKKLILNFIFLKSWIGVYVLDSVLEFLRLSLELNAPALQQRALTTVAYLGQLFNYNVTNTATLFKVFSVFFLMFN